MTRPCFRPQPVRRPRSWRARIARTLTVWLCTPTSTPDRPRLWRF